MLLSKNRTIVKKPLILITNDDGYRSKGISTLIAAAREYGEVVVVAPNNSKSGQSHAITVKEFLRLTKMQEEDGLTIYRSSGTPVDCIKLAVQELQLKPDLILSGINHGINSSVSVHYSGTMGAVKEGCLLGIPSIGFSLDDFTAQADFSNCIKVIQRVIPKILEHPLPKWTCLNVNIPKVAELKGIKVCRQAHGVWQENFDKRTDPHGQNYYWLTGAYHLIETQAQDTDEWALRNGFASVVPTTVDTTAYHMLDEVSEWGI